MFVGLLLYLLECVFVFIVLKFLFFMSFFDFFIIFGVAKCGVS